MPSKFNLATYFIFPLHRPFFYYSFCKLTCKFILFIFMKIGSTNKYETLNETISQFTLWCHADFKNRHYIAWVPDSDTVLNTNLINYSNWPFRDNCGTGVLGQMWRRSDVIMKRQLSLTSFWGKTLSFVPPRRILCMYQGKSTKKSRNGQLPNPNIIL